MKGLQVGFFDRHELNEVYGIFPKGHKNFPEGKTETKIEAIREAIQKYGYWAGRKDICMVNIWIENKPVTQYVVEPTQSGDPSFGKAGHWLTHAQMDKCREINALVCKAEKEFNLPAGTLTVE